VRPESQYRTYTPYVVQVDINKRARERVSGQHKGKRGKTLNKMTIIQRDAEHIDIQELSCLIVQQLMVDKSRKS
jgi:hypothetical protein